MALWVIRILFVCLCTVGGYAVSQVRPEFIGGSFAGLLGMVIGFGFGWLMIALDEMLKGFSLRAFSATTFGLLLGTVVALLIDRSGLFEYVDEPTTRWLVRLGLFLSFGYIGIVLAMRSNKEVNLRKIAELQSVKYVNIHEVAKSLRVILVPGETLSLRIVREGKDKGQGVGYMPDGTMVVVNNAHSAVGQHIEVQVQSLLQTGAGVIVFAELKQPMTA